MVLDGRLVQGRIVQSKEPTTPRRGMMETDELLRAVKALIAMNGCLNGEGDVNEEGKQ